MYDMFQRESFFFLQIVRVGGDRLLCKPNATSKHSSSKKIRPSVLCAADSIPRLAGYARSTFSLTMARGALTTESHLEHASK